MTDNALRTRQGTDLTAVRERLAYTSPRRHKACHITGGTAPPASSTARRPCAGRLTRRICPPQAADAV